MSIELQLDDQALWKKRFRMPKLLYTQMAKAAPGRGMAVCDKSGMVQLYAWEVSCGAMRQLTDLPCDIWFGSIAPDGRHIYYLADQQGDELGHYVRVPFEGGEAEDISPDLPVYSSYFFGMSHACNRLGYLLATPDGCQLFSQTVSPGGELGAPQLLYQHPRIGIGPYFSAGGDLAVLAVTERAVMQHYNLVALDAESGERLAELWDGPETSLEAVGFCPVAGDTRLLASSNRSGVKRPVIWNPRTGERIDLELRELAGEVFPKDWSPDGRRVLLCQFNQAVQQLYTYDLPSGRLRRLNHPSGTYGFFVEEGIYFSSEDEIFAQWQDSTHPSQVIGIDSRNDGQPRTVLNVSQELPCQAWRSVSFPSTGGQTIQGWLGVPDGAGPFPTILNTHGGPESLRTDMYNPMSQVWMDHGFAFLTVNYRGSITFGREFQEAIWGHPGDWEIEDMAAAREWLVQQGIAHPKQVFLEGWSYGGYLTLLALGKRPELWAGGMAGIAVTDWAMMYEDAADTLRSYQVALFGGTPDEKPEQYARSSPIRYAEAVRAPVMILQGRNDTRTPARPVEVYEQKLKALGKPVDVHWFDAGHLGGGVELDIQQHELMLRFAERVLRAM